jgi:ABC-type phosphate transport system substrate-binding protein
MKIYPRYQIIIFAILLFTGSFFAGAASASSKQTLIITGTGSSIGAMQLMAKGFQKRHPGVTVQGLPGIGSTGGIKAVNEDKIDTGLSYRPLTPGERRAKIIEPPCGRTAFIFGVQESNPTTGFTLAEMAEIVYQHHERMDGSGYPGNLKTVADACLRLFREKSFQFAVT